MRALRKIFERPDRKLLFLASAAALLSTAGCSLMQNEDEGDPEPNVGEYRVTLSPNSESVVITPESSDLSIQFNLLVQCVGPFLPSTCDANKPNWVANQADIAGVGGTVVISDNLMANTYATISLSMSTYLAKRKSDSSLLGQKDVKVIPFYPTHVPKDLVVTGNRNFTLTLFSPTPGGERQEQPPDKPDLVAFPADIHLFPPTPSSCPVQITYKGPPTDLLLPEVTGSGASEFTVTAVGGFPYPLIGDGGGPSLTVTYLVSGGGGTATLTLRTKPIAGAPNGLKCTVPLRGG